MVEMLSLYVSNPKLVIGFKEQMQTVGYRQNIELINW